MRRLYHFLDRLIQAGGAIAGILIILTTGMTTFDVIARSVFNRPTTWATELCIYAIIGSCFLGSAYTLRTYSHITVDLLINLVPSKAQKILAYASNVCGFIFSLIFTIYSVEHVVNTYQLGTTSSSLLRIPMYLPEMFLPIGGLLLCIAFILQIVDGEAQKGDGHL
ncbi:TRAP transporter small permease [Geobacillus stearothermophilus]|uniref:TRAP transporter small permease n=1 Tax=Geobacillus sp. Manikaran-105 TaxID=2055940 RepID=UPI000C288A5E|nr:TRAP transporter small permease [Geobacillus sp. Manikaran-105]PJW13422.1 TRAP transporter small permease [Geobacillus sp. Manikaran-105]WJQ00947.1 TRAP transporter small permease [Geobacillus stearothermophilus]WJQ04359.1 TRAP transporter small permease [Geobacillus stearothermophilus]